jgi:hypothetical protein
MGRGQSSRLEDPPRQGVAGRNIVDSVTDGQFNPQRACRPCARGVTTLIGSMRLFASIELDVHSRATSRFPRAWSIVRTAVSAVNLLLLRAI